MDTVVRNIVKFLFRKHPTSGELQQRVFQGDDWIWVDFPQDNYHFNDGTSPHEDVLFTKSDILDVLNA